MTPAKIAQTQDMPSFKLDLISSKLDWLFMSSSIESMDCTLRSKGWDSLLYSSMYGGGGTRDPATKISLQVNCIKVRKNGT